MPNSYIATKTNISEQPWWIPYKNIQTNVLGCLQSENAKRRIRKGQKKNKKRLKEKSEKAKRKIRNGPDEKEGEEEDEEEEGKVKDRKRICIKPLEISPPLNFAPRPSMTPAQGGM